MGITWEEPRGGEVQKTEPVPYERIMIDLSQGFGISNHHKDGTTSTVWKVFKTLGKVQFDVSLHDHDIGTGEEGFSLNISRSIRDQAEGLEIIFMNVKKIGNPNSHNFQIADVRYSSVKFPIKEFWREYEEAQIDVEAKNKAIERNVWRKDVELELNPPAIRLSLGTPSK